MEAFTYRLTEEQLSDFKTLGYAYLENYVSKSFLDSLRATISEWSAAYAAEFGFGTLATSSSPDQFDDALLTLRKKDVAGAGRVYDAIKKMPLFMQWACDQRHVELARQFLDTENVGVASRGWGMRIDYPHDTKHKTQLHQDIVSQLCGPRGVVIWSPLRDVTSDMGPVVLYPGSHLHGIFPIEARGAASQDFVIRDETALQSRFPAIAPEVKAGDAVVIDFMLLHESGFNASSNPRWSMLTRMFDAAEPRSIRIGWRGGLQEGNFYGDVAGEIAPESE